MTSRSNSDGRGGRTTRHGDDARAVGLGSLGSSVERLVAHLGGPPITVLTTLSDHWADIVGPALAEATRPVGLVDGVLTVACRDGAWASQVGWMENQIIDNLNQVFAAAAGGENAVVRRVAVRVENSGGS